MAERKVSAGASSKVAKKQLQDIVDPIRTSIDQLTKSISGMVKDLNVVFDKGTKGAKNQAHAISTAVKASHLFQGEINKLQRGIGELTGDVTKMAFSTEKGFSKDAIQGYLKSINEVAKGIEALEKEIEDKKDLEGSALDEISKKLKEQRAVYQQLEKNIIATRDATHDVADAYEATGKGMGYAGDMLKFWKASPGSILKSASAAKDHAEALGEIGEKYKGLPGALGKIGSAAKGAGKLLGGLTKLAMPLAILSGIFAAAKAIWNLGMEADKFVKNANKGFASVRGPDIMTKDVAAQFKKFNDQIYSVSKNLEVGLNADEVRGFLQSIVQAGTNLGKLETGMLSYRDAVYVAAKASRSLGLDLPYVGSMVAELINNFRLGMDKIDETFTQIAFDARKAGLSADRFWGVVQNASASLSLYNVAIGAAGKTMTRFSEDMIGGSDDAAKATEDMFQVFKSGAMSSQAAIIDFANQSGNVTNKMFQDLAEKFKGKNVNLKGRIELLEGKKDRSSAETEELKKLRTEVYANNQKSIRYERMIGKGSVQQATEMGALAEDAPELLMKAITAMTGVRDMSQITGDKIWVAIKAAEKQGISEKVVRMLVEETAVTADRLQNMADSSGKFFDSAIALSKSGNTDIIAGLDLIGKTTGDDQILATQQLAQLLQSQLGMDEGMAQDWALLLSSSENSRKELSGLLRGQKGATVQGFLDSEKMAKLNQKMTLARTNKDQFTANQMSAMSDDTFKEIRDQTLSFEEMQKIGTDAFKWYAYNYKMFTMINKGVFDIFKWLTKGEAYQTDEQKNAAEQLKLLKTQNPILSNILKTDGDGNITAESQKEAQLKSLEMMKMYKKSTMVSQNINKDIEAALSSKDSYKAVDVAYGKAKQGMTSTANPEEKAFYSTLEQRWGSIKKNMDVLKEISGGSVNDVADIMSKTSDPGMIKELQGIKDETVDKTKQEKWENFKTKMAKKSAGYLSEIKASNDTQIKQNESKLQLFTQASTYLSQLDETNKQALYWQKLLVKASPEAMKEIADEAQILEGSGLSTEDAAKKMSVSVKDLHKAYKMSGGKKAGYNVEGARKAVKEEYVLKGVQQDSFKSRADVASEFEKTEGKILDAPSPEKLEQGLRNPMQVTKPKMATLLHRGEWILPKNITPPDMAYTTPKRIKEVPANPTLAAAPGGAAQKSITINVNATEKDLAQRIANEIRGVLYKEQLTGMR
jgi:hypothetical protein